jgi:VanZ family protein
MVRFAIASCWLLLVLLLGSAFFAAQETGRLVIPVLKFMIPAAWVALSICVACAFTDEVHQSMLPSRQGSARDFVIDAFSATAMLTVARGRTIDDGRRVRQAMATEPAD